VFCGHMFGRGPEGDSLNEYYRNSPSDMTSLATFRRFIGFLKPYWKKGFLALLLMMIGVALQLPMPFLTKYLLDEIIAFKNFTLLNVIGIALVGVLMVRVASGFLERLLLAAFRARVLFDLRLTLFKHVQQLPLSFVRARQTGYVMSRIGGDVEAVQGLLADTLVSGLQNILVFAAGVVCTLYIHPRLATISFSILPVYGLSLWFFNRRIRRMSLEVRERHAVVQEDLQELLSGLSTIKAFSREKHSMQRMAHSVKQAVRWELKLEITSALAALSSILISAAGPIALVWYGSFEIMKGSLTIGGLVAFSSFLRYLFGPTQALMNLNIGVQRSLAACERIFEILDVKTEVARRANAICLKHINGDLVFQDVTFSYNEEKILDGLCFRVKPGQFVAIVGRSGVGKTTLVHLILRFFDPQRGTIFLDGHDIRELELSLLRRTIGLVSQEVFLFGTTVKENIRFGRLDATDYEIMEAAKLAYADRFIRALEHGYATNVGERGVSLSGGERQRIAIARAILKDPKILILDEATSHLDSASETHIQAALGSLVRGRTTLVIAHRLSTIRDAETILVLDHGKVVEQGTHDELYRSGGPYRELLDQQFNKRSH